MIKKIFAFFLFATLFSCASKKDVVYFQNIQSLTDEVKNYEPVIKPDDVLIIFVSSPVPELAKDFNLVAFGSFDKSESVSQLRLQTYLVNNVGEIDFPILGTLKLGGLSRSQAVEKMKDALTKYIKDPIVNIRISNYKISVLGEVTRPGSYSIASERITLPEALALASDMTIYGDRKNVLVIRENNGVKTYNQIDITDVNFFKSPFYYLSQNDVVYVSPNKTKVNASSVGPNTTVIISSVSLLITVIALIVR